MSGIQFNHVFKQYESGDTWAIHDFNLTIPAGSFVVLLGPSGCGKTTLLKMVNRLYEPTRGEICVHGKDIRLYDAIELRRSMGYSIQQTGLFPHMTVEKNIAVVPRLMGWAEDKIEQRVRELLALMNLDADQYMNRYPSQLSGGQQQRVGLARALAADPSILLMDEPFGALDAITRAGLQTEISELHQKLKKTILFVTHDVDEALRLADFIAVMKNGKLIQFDRPFNLLNNPANPFVSELVDSNDKIRQISLIKVYEVMQEIPDSIPEETPTIQENKTVREALSLLLNPHNHGILVMEGDQPVGWITMEVIRHAGNLK